MRERLLEQVLRRQAQKQNILVCKFVSPATRGVPDNVVIWPDGQLDFVELKTKTGKLSDLQRYWLRRLTDMHQDCYVLYGASDISEYLERKLKPWTSF